MRIPSTRTQKRISFGQFFFVLVESRGCGTQNWEKDEMVLTRLHIF